MAVTGCAWPVAAILKYPFRLGSQHVLGYEAPNRMPTENLEFEDLLECYQFIGTHLSAAAPEPWKSIKLTVLIDEISSLHTASYEPADASRPKASFVVKSPPYFDFAFLDLRELTSDAERGFFKKCIFTLDSSGNYDVEFDYDIEDMDEAMEAVRRSRDVL